MKNLCLLLFLAIFISCSKEDCSENVTGMYIGMATSSGVTFEGEMTVAVTPVDPPRMWIQDEVFSFTGFLAQSSCNTISIDSQPASDVNGSSLTVSGILHLNGNTLTGVLTFDNGGTEIVCSYNLVRG